MRLSRAEAIAIIREAAKQFPEGHDTLKDVVHTICTWGVFANDALATLQQAVALDRRREEGMSHELALRVAALETAPLTTPKILSVAADMHDWIENWIDTPFFKTRKEWEAWVIPMRARANEILEAWAEARGWPR